VSNINTAAVSGNLTKDPELRHTANGTAVCNLRVAVNRRRKDGDDWTDETSYFDITVWTGFGELCARKLSKGSAITASGRLEQREWEAQDGSKRSAVSIVADQVDGPDFYKPSSQDNDVTAEPAGAAAEGQTQLAADDDIPF